MKNSITHGIISAWRTKLSGNYKLFAENLNRKLFYLIAAGIGMMHSNGAFAQYCSSNPSCGNASISSVNFNGTINTSGAGTYTLYSSPTFTITPLQGCTITISGTIAFAGNYHLNAWIDFDGSGDWNGVNSELIAIPTVSYALGAFTKTTTFTVPATATVGNSRLRVQLRYVGPVFGAPNPCVNNFCGEVEDYPVVIAPLPPLCPSASNNSSGIYISRTDINGQTTFSGASTYSSYLPGITLFPQTNYTLSVDVTNPTSTDQSVYIYGWLEVNGDNVFSQNANEQIVVTPTLVIIPAFTTQPFSKSFYYTPPYATQASTLRVTASLASDGAPSPCKSSFTGEVEDYSVVMHTDYCTDAGTDNFAYINNVILNGVSNPSGPGLYSDYTGVIIPLFPGQNFPVTVNTGGSSTLTSVYVDFNQNGYFQDTGEQIDLTSGGGSFTGNIAVPGGATIGNTRMRVVTLYTNGGGNALPCYLNGVSGEVEDYTVMILSPNPPAISCGSDIVVSQEPGQCYKQVTYSLPVCTSNCNGGILTLTNGFPSGANFPMGTTPVTYTVTTPAGSSFCTFYVTVNLDPLPVFSPAGTITICQGNSANLNVSTYASYLWSTGATTQGITTSTAGDYTVTVTSNQGCTGSVSQSVVVNPLPTPAITGSTTFCASSSTTLDAGAFAGYNWSTGATTQTVSVNTSGTFTVTVTSANGCSGSTSATTMVNQNPTPAISGTTSFCAGSSTTLDAGTFPGYNWSTGATTQTISANSAGTFTVTVTNANGCSGSTSATTTVNQNPTPAISGTTSFCEGSSATLDAGTFSGYNWSTGATTQTISVNSAGTFTVTVTNINGCSGSASATTTVNTAFNWYLDADNDGHYASGPVSACSSPGAGYNTTATQSGDCDDNDNTKWQNASLYIDADGDGYNAGTQTVCYGASIPAGYSTTTSGSDCNDNNTAINPGVTEVCSNGSDDNCNGQADENCGVYTYYADVDQDTYGNPSASITSNSNVPPAGYVTNNTDCNDNNGAVHPGAADICNSIDDNCSGVIDENAINATVTPGGNFSFCTGTTVTLAANTGFGLTYQWTKNGTNIPGATQSTYTTQKGASYQVKETNSFACSATSATTTLTKLSKPTAAITAQGSLDLCGINSVVMDANSGAGLLYQWKRNAGYITGATNQTYTATIKGNYRCIVSNSAGCTAASNGLKVTKSCKEAMNEMVTTSLNVYPNPTDGTFSLELKLGNDVSAEADVQIMNVFGQSIYLDHTAIVNGELIQEIKLDQNVPSGNYFVRVILEDRVFTGQLVFQK